MYLRRKKMKVYYFYEKRDMSTKYLSIFPTIRYIHVHTVNIFSDHPTWVKQRKFSAYSSKAT